MSAVTYYHDGSGWVDISDRVPKEAWELTEQAEEGDAGTSTISVADPALDFEPHAHRPVRVLEPTSEVDDDIVFEGFTWNDESSRGSGAQDFDPLARSIDQTVNDANAIWQRPVMRGSDCNRPAETDVARVQWLLGTNEYAIFDDVTTYVHTGSTHNMDANDYRGQTGDQVMRDCAEESGKNWWAKYINNGATRDLVAWYGRDSEDTYDSPLGLSNDPTEWVDSELLDGTSVVWLMQDPKVSRDYSRIYCGIYAQYDGGATFRHNTTTHTAYFGDPGPDSHRVMVVPMPNVHTKATAQRRADRMLDDIGDPDIHISTTVRLPAAKVTQLRAGMRVTIHLTHEPEFDGWKWCRIVNATPKPVAAGSFYDVAIEATPTGPPDAAGPGGGLFTGNVFAGLQRADHYGTPAENLGYAYDANTGGPGWSVQATTGPIHVGEVVAPFMTIVADQAMVVRIHCRVQGADAYFPAVTRFASVTVNGAVVGTDSRAAGPGFEAWDRTVDLRNYHLDAGDVVSFTGSVTDDWGNLATDQTYFYVGRGTFPSINAVPADLAPPGWSGP